MTISSHRLTVSRRRFLQLTGGATSLLLLNACVAAQPTAQMPDQSTASASDQPRRGGVLRIACSDDVSTFDPMRALSNLDLYLGPHLYSALVQINNTPTGIDLQPQLAESWTVSEDGLHYTFRLRQELRFSHGTLLTADDVKHSLDYVLNPTTVSPLASYLPPLRAIEVVDAQTIVFTLEEPTASFLTAIGLIFIVPHDRTGEQLAAEATGAGPFILGERTPGERVVLKRNPTYWNKELPYLDEVQFLVIPESTVQAAALNSGSLDMMVPTPLGVLPLLQDTPGVQVVEGPPTGYVTFAMRVDQEPFSDLRVRQAFKYAIDRPTLLKAILQGRGQVGNDQPIAPSTPFWADVAPFPYDMEKAKALLQEAGYADGLTVELAVAELGFNIVETAVVLQEMFKAAGINLTLNKVPADTYWSNTYMQVPFFVSYDVAVSEPDFILSLLYLSTGVYNETGLADPTLDALIHNGRRASDLAARKQIYAEVQQRISDQGAVLIPLFQALLWSMRTQVRGLVPSNGLRLRADLLWLAPEQ